MAPKQIKSPEAVNYDIEKEDFLGFSELDELSKGNIDLDGDEAEKNKTQAEGGFASEMKNFKSVVEQSFEHGDQEKKMTTIPTLELPTLEYLKAERTPDNQEEYNKKLDFLCLGACVGIVDFIEGVSKPERKQFFEGLKTEKIASNALDGKTDKKAQNALEIIFSAREIKDPAANSGAAIIQRTWGDFLVKIEETMNWAQEQKIGEDTNEDTEYDASSGGGLASSITGGVGTSMALGPTIAKAAAAMPHPVGKAAMMAVGSGLTYFGGSAGGTYAHNTITGRNEKSFWESMTEITASIGDSISSQFGELRESISEIKKGPNGTRNLAIGGAAGISAIVAVGYGLMKLFKSKSKDNDVESESGGIGWLGTAALTLGAMFGLPSLVNAFKDFDASKLMPDFKGMVKDGIDGLTAELGDAVDGLGDKITGSVTGAIDNATGGLFTKAGDIIETVGETVEGSKEWIAEKTQELEEFYGLQVIDGMEDGGIKEAITTVFGTTPEEFSTRISLLTTTAGAIGGASLLVWLFRAKAGKTGAIKSLVKGIFGLKKIAVLGTLAFVGLLFSGNTQTKEFKDTIIEEGKKIPGMIETLKTSSIGMSLIGLVDSVSPTEVIESAKTKLGFSDEVITEENAPKWKENILSLTQRHEKLKEKANGEEPNSFSNTPYKGWNISLQEQLQSAQKDIQEKKFPISIDFTNIVFLYRELALKIFPEEKNPVKVTEENGSFSIDIQGIKFSELTHNPTEKSISEHIAHTHAHLIYPLYQVYEERGFFDILENLLLLNPVTGPMIAPKKIREMMQSPEGFTEFLKENAEIGKMMLVGAGIGATGTLAYKAGVLPLILKIAFAPVKAIFSTVLHPRNWSMVVKGAAMVGAYSFFNSEHNLNSAKINNIQSCLGETGEVLQCYSEKVVGDEKAAQAIKDIIPQETKRWWDISYNDMQVENQGFISKNISSLEVLKTETLEKSENNDTRYFLGLIKSLSIKWEKQKETQEIQAFNSDDISLLRVLAERLGYTVSISSNEKKEYILQIGDQKIHLPENPLPDLVTIPEMEDFFYEQIGAGLAIIKTHSSITNNESTALKTARKALWDSVTTLQTANGILSAYKTNEAKREYFQNIGIPMLQESLSNYNKHVSETRQITLEAQEGIWILSYDDGYDINIFYDKDTSLESITQGYNQEQDTTDTLGKNAYTAHEFIAHRILDYYKNDSSPEANEIITLCYNILSKGTDAWEAKEFIRLSQILTEDLHWTIQWIGTGLVFTTLEGISYSFAGAKTFLDNIFGSQDGDTIEAVTGAGVAAGAALVTGGSLWTGFKITKGMVSIPIEALRAINSPWLTAQNGGSKTVSIGLEALKKGTFGLYSNKNSSTRLEKRQIIRTVIDHKLNLRVYGQIDGSFINKTLNILSKKQNALQDLLSKNNKLPKDKIQIQILEKNISTLKDILRQKKYLAPLGKAAKKLASTATYIANKARLGESARSQLLAKAKVLGKVLGPVGAVQALFIISNASNPQAAAAETAAFMAAFTVGGAVGGPIGVGVVAIGTLIWGEEFSEFITEEMKLFEAKVIDKNDWASQYHQAGEQMRVGKVFGDLWDNTIGEYWKGDNAYTYFSDTNQSNFTVPSITAPMTMLMPKTYKVHRKKSDIASWNEHINAKIKVAKSSNDNIEIPALEAQIIDREINPLWFEDQKTQMESTLRILNEIEDKNTVGYLRLLQSFTIRMLTYKNLEIIDDIEGKTAVTYLQTIGRYRKETLPTTILNLILQL